MNIRETDTTSETSFTRTGFLAALLTLSFLTPCWAQSTRSSAFLTATLLNRSSFRISVCLVAMLLSISAFIRSLYWLQPIILFALIPAPMVLADTANILSFYFFVCGTSLSNLLYSHGKHEKRKIAIWVSYYCLCQVVVGIYQRVPPVNMIITVGASAGITLFLYNLFSETRQAVPHKPELSLSKLGLSKTESEYLLALIQGASIKEIAVDSGVKESTVRNTLARVYRKFDVHDKAMLLAKCEKYTLVD